VNVKVAGGERRVGTRSGPGPKDAKLPRMSRRVARHMRMPEMEGEPLAYPSRLLKQPSAVMFFVMREAYQLSQKRAREAGEDPARTMRFPHLAILAALEEFGPASQKEISQRLKFDPSDLVTFVDLMEQAGWVARKRDGRDRRRYALEMTKAGRMALQRRDHDADRFNEQLFGALGKGERDLLRNMLLKVLAHHDPRVRAEAI
jgi:DNA-binding MarR family transcriptional regulator